MRVPQINLLIQQIVVSYLNKEKFVQSNKKSYDKWETPIAFQLAVIKQESSLLNLLNQKNFWYHSNSRPSTAFGYAPSAINMEWYKTNKIKMHQEQILRM